MKIRKCQEKDIEAVGSLYDKVVAWLDDTVNYPKWTYKVYPTERTARENTKAQIQYLCEEEGKIVGAFALNDDPQANYDRGNWSRDLPVGSYMVLHTLAIDPDYMDCGYGSQVMDFCLARAKSLGYKAFRTDIVPENIPARRFYEKNGFTYAGEADLERGIEDIPVFGLLERNWG